MPRPRSPKPLLGFGPVGWLAAAVLAALIGLLLAGIDPRYELLRFTHNTLGPRSMDALLLRILTPLNLAEWRGQGHRFGPIAMCAALVALQIHPRRAGLARTATVVAAGLGFPFLYWYLLLLAMGIVGRSNFAASRYADAGILLAFGLLTAALLRWWTRAHRPALCFLPWLLGIPVLTLLAFNLPEGWVLPWTHDAANRALKAAVLSFNPALAAILLVWAIRARLRPADAGRCAACDYDLAGLAAARCPECGAPLESTPAPPPDPAPPSAPI